MGAVDLSVRLSSLAGIPFLAKPGELSPLEIEPQILNFVEQLPARTILMHPKKLAITSPLLLVHIHLDSMIFSETHGDSRPQIGPYHATYQLPGGVITPSPCMCLYFLETWTGSNFSHLHGEERHISNSARVTIHTTQTQLGQ